MSCVLIRIETILMSTHNILHFTEDRKDVPKLSHLPLDPTFAMINPQRFELPMSRTNSHGSKDVQAIYCIIMI